MVSVWCRVFRNNFLEKGAGAKSNRAGALQEG